MVEQEFSASGVSMLREEYEDLIPEYLFESDGLMRTQYILPCGLILTEPSMEELRKIVL